jgi:putative transposase
MVSGFRTRGESQAESMGRTPRDATSGKRVSNDTSVGVSLSECARSRGSMPRQPRSIRPGGVYHLISRFVDREWFISATHERTHYIALLGRALGMCDWKLLAYAVMSNHIHLATIAGRMPLDQWVRRIHSPFADSMNRVYDRIGSMFVRGPKAHEVVVDDVGVLIAYIHNNPVRAGVCDRPAASDWTSHRAFIGKTPVPAWLNVSDALSLASLDAEDFDSWVADPARREHDAKFTEAAHEQNRQRADVLAPSRNIVCSRDVVANELGEELVLLAADAFGLSVSRLRSRARGRQELAARTAAVHAASHLGLTGAQIAKALDISQQRVSVLRRQPANDEVAAASTGLISRVGASGCGRSESG